MNNRQLKEANEAFDKVDVLKRKQDVSVALSSFPAEGYTLSASGKASAPAAKIH